MNFILPDYTCAICCEPLEADLRREASLLGRRAAAWALRLRGCDEGIVTRDPVGAPIWPSGWCGSIAHTQIGGGVLAIAMVAEISNAVSIGIDIEGCDRNVDLRIWRRIATAAEIARESEAVPRDRILQVFTAKEAIYKALFPRIRRFVGFREVSINWIPLAEPIAAPTSLDFPSSNLVVNGYSAPLTLRAQGIVDAPTVVPSGEQITVQLFSDGRLLVGVAQVNLSLVG